MLQNSQEVEFQNQNYKQRYCKSLKRWNFWTKITDRNIAKFSRGGIYETKITGRDIARASRGGIYKTINAGRNIENFSRGEIYKPGSQAKILQYSKETRLFPDTTYSQKYESTKDEPRKDWKISASTGGTETIVWNRCSYQVPAMVWTNAYKNENHKLYNSTVQSISRGVGYCAKFVGVMCVHFVDMGAPVKTQVKMVSVSSLICGARPLICLTKPFLY